MAAAVLKSDAVLADAAGPAREALVQIAEPGSVGEHLGMDMLDERLAMHWYACTSRAYVGWRWGVSVARVPRSKQATVCETNLLPAGDAVLAPEWLPWADRLAPGDVGPGDELPIRPDDPNLEHGFEATGDEDVDQVGFFELGLGRVRVLSAEGREAAATRWFDGDRGPSSDHATKAHARCSSCGYFLPMNGALRSTFGVCANEWSPADGQIVALGFGCGAHSETDAPASEPGSTPDPLLDELALDVEVREPATASEPLSSSASEPFAPSASEPSAAADADSGQGPTGEQEPTGEQQDVDGIEQTDVSEPQQA